MDAENPYAPPRASLEAPDAIAINPLASRWLRLFAALIDTIFMLGLDVVLIIGIPQIHPVDTRYTFDLLFSEDPLFVTASTVGWILANIWLLAQGQTIGKRLLSIRVVRVDGRRVSLLRMIFIRMLPIQLVGWIPVAGPWIALASLLLIFGRRRRCLHDYFADTIVVRAK